LPNRSFEGKIIAIIVHFTLLRAGESVEEKARVEEVCTPPFHNSAVTDIGSQLEPDRMNSIMICRYA